MEDLDDKILEELKEKAIERTGDVEIEDNTIDEDLLDKPSSSGPATSPQPVKKSKKVRSEKQIAAFEKARIKRAENLKIKREIEAEKKAKKKKEKEEVKAEVKQRLESKKEQPALVRQNARPDLPNDFNAPPDRYGSSMPYKEQVVNNYYYYGAPPPGTAPDAPLPRERKKKQTKKKVKRPPTPSESSEEEYSEDESGGANFVYDEPESYKDLQREQDEERYGEQEEEEEQLTPQFKFRYA